MNIIKKDICFVKYKFKYNMINFANAIAISKGVTNHFNFLVWIRGFLDEK